VRCSYHLAAERPTWRTDGLPSCVLDVADEGGIALEAVGEALGITRERARQIEAAALAKVRKVAELAIFAERRGDGRTTVERRRRELAEDEPTATSNDDDGRSLAVGAVWASLGDHDEPRARAAMDRAWRLYVARSQARARARERAVTSSRVRRRRRPAVLLRTCTPGAL
jgi:hypothetical protein